MPATLKSAVQNAFASLDDNELSVFTLAVLHGLPVRQPIDEGVLRADGNDIVIHCLKKLRAALAEHGFDPVACRKLLGRKKP